MGIAREKLFSLEWNYKEARDASERERESKMNSNNPTFPKTNSNTNSSGSNNGYEHDGFECGAI